jgi:hypothetical protein
MKKPEPKIKVESFCRECGKPIPPLPFDDAFCVKCRYKTDDEKAVAVGGQTEIDNALDKTPATEQRPDSVGEIYKLLDEFGFSIPIEKRPEFSESLNFILEGRGNDRREVFVSEFLRLMTDGLTPDQAGQRMFVVSYLIGNEVKTQRELADLLKVSESRVSQIKGELPSELVAVCNLKSRTIKGQDIGER